MITLTTIVAIAAVGLIATLMASGALIFSQTVHMSGVVASANIGIYSDAACTQSLTTVNWGTISPGNSVTTTVYVKNIGTVPLTLSMAPTNWAPSNANGYLTLIWNRQNNALAVGSSISATLTLTASASAGSLTNFSVDTVISGTG